MIAVLSKRSLKLKNLRINKVCGVQIGKSLKSEKGAVPKVNC
ncbi:hypothetical protein DSOL_0993 [Desulfosporosinus metallidurans]|uniref:Uncharacterized protein n=1 Tax=Desulfosporosinus metallidurans TaxID=1888891 RepID=A0A1Q8R124_9FIRM|nr:hypothetical protein DSOL_0993 [Desulfosporosinus metallidurans]